MGYEVVFGVFEVGSLAWFVEEQGLGFRVKGLGFRL